jgi:hypothetical protein
MRTDGTRESTAVHPSHLGHARTETLYREVDEHLLSIFMDRDSMVGKDFEACLANLKALTEREKGEVT